MDIELCNEIRISLAHVIHYITLITPRRIHSLNAKDLMTGAFGSAAHVVKAIVDLPSAFPTRGRAVVLQVVWIDILSMQKAEDTVESLLSTAHASLTEILPAYTI